MINIPNQDTRIWNQPNTSDLFGNLFVTKNLTFDQRGYAALSHSPRAVITEATNNFDNVAAMIHNRDYDYFVATWDTLWTVDDVPLSVAPSEINTGGVIGGDIQNGVDYLGSLMVVSDRTSVAYYNATSNTWTDTDITLTSDGQHDIANILSLNALAIANVNTVGLYANPMTATPSLITTLTIPTDFEITKMIYFNQNLYIGTQNVVGGLAAMYVWNGQGTAAQQVYKVNSNIIFSLCVHKDAIYALFGNGALMKFTGGAFSLAAAFPMYYSDQSLTDYLNTELYKDIMRSNDNVLFINFSNTNNLRNSLTCQPDGVWAYDENIGLYHRYSNTIDTPVYQLSISTANVDTTTNQITVTAAPVSGTECYYEDGGGTPIGGLIDGQKYFVIKIDATHIQLATTYQNATATPPVPIDLTGTGSNFQDILFFPNIDFGQFYAGRPTAVLNIDIPTEQKQYGVDILWGTEVFRRDTNSDYGTLMTASDGLSTRGYFITPKIMSRDVTDNYDLLTLKFLPFVDSTNKIIIKYRTSDDMRNFIDITSNDWKAAWTSTTTFTVTPTTTVWEQAQVGDEVEVLTGAAGGMLAHISTISENAGVYTITLDEAYPDYTTGDDSVVVFRNWTKFKTIEYGDSNAEQHFLAEHLGLAGEFLQLKVELRGVGIKIIELLVDNVFRLPAKDR